MGAPLGLVLAALAAPAVAGSKHHGHDRPGRDGQLFRQADTNRDGRISRGEFLAMSTRKANRAFDRLDDNRDGVISQAERRDAWDDRRDRRGPRR